MNILATVISLSMVFAACIPATAGDGARRRARYWLEVQPIVHKAKGDHDTACIVRLRGARLRRIVWSRKTQCFVRADWSEDHRAVAVENMDGLFVWREGEPMHSLGMPGCDYFMGCIWAPDKQRLLVRGGVSADSDIGPYGAGSLFWLKFTKGHPSDCVLKARGVWKATWRGNRMVRYWVYTDLSPVLRSKSYLWRAP